MQNGRSMGRVGGYLKETLETDKYTERIAKLETDTEEWRARVLQLWRL